MNHHLWAAVSALAVSFAPSIVIADQASQVAVIDAYNATHNAIQVTTSQNTQERLLHNAATTHDFISLDSFFPPDPCRAIAAKWNISVFKNAPNSEFDAHLSEAADYKCKVVYQSAQTATGGASVLIKVALTN